MTSAPDSSPTWYDASAPAERPRLTFDLDVDVCVVGAGLAGLTVAREVARRGWSVAVLEAGRIASGASGRNCGFVMPGYAASVDRLIERVGLARAQALWKLSEGGVEHVRDSVRAFGLAAPVEGWLDVSKADNGDAMTAELAVLGQEFGATVEGWPVERVRSVLKTDHYFHSIHYPAAFHIDPLAYVRALAAAAEAEEVRIFEHTPAVEIDPAGVRKRVVTPSGRVRAAHVVLAGNTGLGALVPRLAETVMPVTNYVAVTQPLGERLAAAVAYRGAVSDSRTASHHYRIVDGDRLMWSGEAGLSPRDPHRVARKFAAAIARLYPQLGEVAFSHAWAGTMGFALHRMPQIGEVSPGMWLASAFGGQGLAAAAMAGDLIAAAIVEGDDRWRMFLPFELVWAGGRIGRTVAGANDWARRTREHFVASAARRRETLQKTREAAEAMEP